MSTPTEITPSPPMKEQTTKETQTPRTDAVIKLVGWYNDTSLLVVEADFARTLERESASLLARVAALEEVLKGLLASCDVTSEATDEQLIDARDNGYAPEIRLQAESVLHARAALAAKEAAR